MPLYLMERLRKPMM